MQHVLVCNTLVLYAFIFCRRTYQHTYFAVCVGGRKFVRVGAADHGAGSPSLRLRVLLHARGGQVSQQRLSFSVAVFHCSRDAPSIPCLEMSLALLFSGTRVRCK